MVQDDEEFGFIYAATHACWKVQCRFRSQFRVLYFCGVDDLAISFFIFIFPNTMILVWLYLLACTCIVHTLLVQVVIQVNFLFD